MNLTAETLLGVIMTILVWILISKILVQLQKKKFFSQTSPIPEQSEVSNAVIKEIKDPKLGPFLFQTDAKVFIPHGPTLRITEEAQFQYSSDNLYLLNKAPGTPWVSVVEPGGGIFELKYNSINTRWICKMPPVDNLIHSA